mmetsp:Transcript_932/g.1409  ORF Transcript_932/g.1409 Transcript_932/m.1409 type:complete len:417 (-) Transcript_932:448-1698(-)|eukprot:CAMPEP_0184861984 /NCGR_PEP_ID=MMETSP0580-20130426/6533_1 /TAXON_ID=1118495 /ORGANISM="Dactyliosolen fragilissimus" /LENGTH=416 /DNA_ID=CAMNT_0027359667 /DNA_START=109 /DNA_END=1359 /DNA_ORIENTATION=+
MPSYTLHVPAGSFRAFKVLIAAEYNGVSVDVPEFNAAAVSTLSPTGKAPVLETPNGAIFESNAIARYIAKLRRDTGLTGNGSVLEEAAVDSWCDFSANELEIPACVWWYPAAGYMPFQKAAYEKAKTDFSKALEILDKHLLARTYLVNDQITLADITVASALVYPMKFVCDKAFLKPFGNVVRWFNTCVNQPEFVAVIGKVTPCKKEMTAAGQEAPKAKGGEQGKKKGGKGKGKKEKKEDAPAAPAPVKKVEHPYKIMDKESPSKFSMDSWKKSYSNSTSYDAAMNTFWSTFDAEGWSLWHQNYNYNEDNKRIFMAANAVGGFQQRSDEIRKWAFGVMDVLGTEETVLEIKGIWLFRGDTVEHMVNANDDANWYTWKKLAGKDLPLTDEVKAQVAAYWCSEDELEGKPIQDSKVFK